MKLTETVERKFTLELSNFEAEVLASLTGGHILGIGPGRDVTDSLYGALHDKGVAENRELFTKAVTALEPGSDDPQ